MLKIYSKNQKELFQILDDFSLNLLKIIPCKNIKFVKTLTKSEENSKFSFMPKTWGIIWGTQHYCSCSR